MKSHFLFSSLLIAQLGLFSTASFASDSPAAPKTKAQCTILTWPEEGGDTAVLFTKGFEFEADKRVEIFRTKNAIYEVVGANEARGPHLFIDVLDQAGRRIAGASDSIVLGVSRAEPSVVTQVLCTQL